jgi:hypothetical protein
LIVLAIAGLILLVVFLAVPALQRNQRNNARKQEAARISAAVTDCIANKATATNLAGATTCGSAGALGLATTNVAAFTDIAPAGYDQLTQLGYNRPNAEMTTNNNDSDRITYRIGAICNTSGTGFTTTGASTRSQAVLYKVESGVAGASGGLACITSE